MDHETVAAAQHGDRAALDAIYRAHAGMVRLVAGSDDASQDAWVFVVQRLGQLRDPACLAGWLRSVAFNVRRGLARHRARGVEVTGVEVDPACHDDDHAERAETVAKVRRTVAALKPKDREAIGLFYLDGLEQRTISRTLGVPLGTVKRRMRDARRRFARQYREAVQPC